MYYTYNFPISMPCYHRVCGCRCRRRQYAVNSHIIRIQRIRKFHLYHFSAPFTPHLVFLSIFFFTRTFGSSISYYFWKFSTIILNGVKYSCWKSIFTCKNMQISRFKHKFYKLIRVIISNLSLNVVLFWLLLRLSRILRHFLYEYAETGKWEMERSMCGRE